MVTPSLRALFEREGLGVIPLEDGASLLVEELGRAERGPVEIVVLAAQGEAVALPSTRPVAGASPAHSGANGKPETVLQRNVSLDALPVLRSHVIDGHAVLPMAIILEWLAEGAIHRHPGMVADGIDNLKLFKGVVLRDHRPLSVSIRVGRAERRGALLAVPVEMHGRLESGRSVAHASAEVLLAERHQAGERVLAESELEAFDMSREEIYRRVLFHGPEMQAIEHVEGCGERTIAASVATSPPPSRWIDRPLRQTWLTDPLAVDAAFQLMVLWTRERFGASSLPTAVGAYRQFRRAFPSERVRVLASVQHSSEHKALADFEFIDEQGSLVARIESYECVIDPSLNQAFRRNRLAQMEVASS
jgi:hypothetical protein